jgi:hypothetical protein
MHVKNRVAISGRTDQLGSMLFQACDQEIDAWLESRKQVFAQANDTRFSLS